MSKQLTLNSRMVLFAAQQEAARRSHNEITPEHIYIALLGETEGVADYVLARLGVNVETLSRAADEMAGQGESVEHDLPLSLSASRERPLTPEAARVMDLAEAAAKSLYETYIGTEHLLVALTRLEESKIAEALTKAGAGEGLLLTEIALLQNAPDPTDLDAHAAGGDSPIVRVSTQILQEALNDQVVEVHIEPREGDVRVAHLAWGSFSEASTVPKHFLLPLVARFRSMINAPAAPGTDGAITVGHGGRVYELLLSERSTPYGEALVMRILPRPLPETCPEGGDAAGQPNFSAVTSQRMAPPNGASAIADVLGQHALRGRDIIGIEQLTRAEIMLILDVAARLKANKYDATQTQFAQGQTLALLFEKPSLRTRVTFEAGMTQLGGHAIYLEGRLGIRETVPDVARNLERWIDGIMARTFSHQTVLDLAEYSSIPVINGLSDREHPCQALADFQTLGERKGRLAGLKLAYVGDGNNVAHSLMLLAAKVGVDCTIACPKGYEPDQELWKVALECAAETGATLTITDSAVEGVKDADAVYTDVWASMGQEEEAAERAEIFASFQVNAELIRHAKPDALVMHCLPAHRGEEITAEVLEGPQSVVFDQAENRLHAQKAVMSLVL